MIINADGTFIKCRLLLNFEEKNKVEAINFSENEESDICIYKLQKHNFSFDWSHRGD